MAHYIGPNGIIDAIRADEDGKDYKKGEWLMINLDETIPVLKDAPLGRIVCDDVYFHSTFKQKYPKPVGADRVDPPRPVDGPSQCA